MSQKLWDFGGSKKICSILENLLVQCSCLESLVNFMQILTIFFFLLSWGSCQKCAINWASKDGTWLMKLIIIIIITLYGLGVTSRISSWLKKRRRKKKIDDYAFWWWWSWVMIFLLGSSSDLCPVEGIIKEVICHALFSVYTWCEQPGGTVFEDHS